MSLFHAAAAQQSTQAIPRARTVVQPLYKQMKSLASVLVPAHGFVSSMGLNANGRIGIRTQIWSFFKQLIRGCAWAAAIAAGMLVYTTFTQKWKEKGYPAIPIQALIAADQAANNARGIPLGSATGPSMYSPGRGTVSSQTTTTTTSTRQTSLLDLDEYEG